MYIRILLLLCIQYHCIGVSTEIQYVQFNITALKRVPSLPNSDSLRAEMSGNRIQMGARFSLPFQPDPWVHPPSCTMGTGSLSRR